MTDPSVLYPVLAYIVIMLMRTAPMMRRIKALEARCLRLEQAEFARNNPEPVTHHTDEQL
ncbi:MAG: hypothetical protein E6Q97_27825 [Desulfurellales bacterium]|nr:MAG: hypothetical protein E6Q97_27825 [Desulfurellales bacterium]